MNENKTLDRIEETQLPESDLIPLGLIALEVGESVDRVAHRFGDAVQLDDVGMRAVTAFAARAFFTERAEQKARQEEATRRRRAKREHKLQFLPLACPRSRISIPEVIGQRIDDRSVNSLWDSQSRDHRLGQQISVGQTAQLDQPGTVG